MWYHILPTILFLCAVLGIIILILRRIPEASALDALDTMAQTEQRLKQKGVSVEKTFPVKTWLVFWLKRFWNFLLEAKDMRHQGVVQYRIKRMFQKAAPAASKPVPQAVAPVSAPATVPVEEKVVLESQDEAYYLERIKKEPKNLQRYSALGNFYLHTKNFIDAQGVYEYLTKYDPGNSSYWARLAYVRLSRGLHLEAIDTYVKTIALDPSNPSRYYNLGLAYKAVGKWKESAEQFGRACELEPNNVKYKSIRDYAVAQIKS